MKYVLGVIPARLKSTRLPRKMLAMIAGRPLIQHTVERAREAKMLDEVVVATDSHEIADAVRGQDVEVIMTSSRHQSGSDRAAEAVKKFKSFRPDAIVNVQGDEPVIDPRAIDMVARLLLKYPAVPMATVAAPFHDMRDVRRSNHVKVVLDRKGYALYFSRSQIPFPRNPFSRYLKHIGIFGFQRDFLFTYVRLRRTFLELTESLEQLRILENGHRIKVGVGEFSHVSVDTPGDLRRVRILLSRTGRRA